jgi:O-acetyl-ADP-ribose deacetylase (regulator of RNase III)
VIVYIPGDATHPTGPGAKIIAHVVNDVGAWGAGFVLAVSKRWTEPKLEYLKRHPDLGATQLVRVPDEHGSPLFVANMCAQRGLKRFGNPKPLDLKALLKCLLDLKDMALTGKATVHMPRIGCGLAGGDWREVEPIIQDVFAPSGIPVYVYALPERRQ